MQNPSRDQVCVIIAAKDAAGTITTAIASALNETEVAEVIVIDDGSTDTTAETARGADDGSGRLKVVSFDVNKGPSAARNHGIAISSAPLIGVLDADDFFFPGRFKPMAGDDCDFVADNIAFVDIGIAHEASGKIDDFEPEPRFLDLAAFVDGNISKQGVRRGETGFLKPVMRRAFLDAHGLRYNEALRFGEDYDLYVRALAAGARYKVIHSCGYGAVVRGNSLSSRHRTDDLKRLYETDQVVLKDKRLAPAARKSIREHEAHVRARYELRHFLDVKSQSGAGAAIAYVLGKPSALPAIAAGIFNDKTERFRGAGGQAGAHVGTAGLRYLLPASPKA
jgi:succinoglycan biosynthesis protein ExoU